MEQANGSVAVGQQNAVLTQMDQRTSAMQRMERSEKGFLLSNMDEAWKVAGMLAKSGLMPDALKGKPEDILVVLMTGAELGLSPMQSIREVYVVKGKGFVGALLRVALVKQSSQCIRWKLVESTEQVAVIETERRGEGVTRMQYALKDAERAGLLGNDNYKKNPALMLRRRCATQLADEVYPDVVRGVGAVEDAVEALAQEEVQPQRAPQRPGTVPAVGAPPPPAKPRATVDAQVEPMRPLPGFHADATPEELAEGQRIAEGNRRTLAQPLPSSESAAMAEPAPAAAPSAEPTDGEVLLGQVEAFDAKGRDAAEVLAGLRARAQKLPSGPGRNAVGAALNKAKGLLSGAR